MRVNVEEEAWKRIYKMAYEKRLPVHEVAGAVLCLWSNSQELVKVSGTKKEVLSWADLKTKSPEVAEEWFEGFIEFRFISLEGDDVYKIHGNEKQLKSAAANIARASKGGQALKKKVSDLSKLQAGSKPAMDEKPSKLQAGSKRPNAKQGNAKQSSAGQGNPKPEGSPVGEGTAAGTFENLNAQESGLGAIPEFSGSKTLSSALNHVPQNLQRTWLDHWGDKSWLINTLEKGVMHYLGAKIETSWSIVLNKWLFTEKVQPVSRKYYEHPSSSEAHDPDGYSAEERGYAELLKANGVKDFVGIIGTIKKAS
ncbi:MAG: ANTAR domain-containing protein [Bdellovibrio sp.]|nr:ANTAR domain-containing protein [Bdellovibrio sp.]